MDFDTQEKLIAQRRAQYMQQQGSPMPEGRMVGGRLVGPNALEYIAAGLRQFGGMRGEQLANQELTDLQKKRQEAMAEALRTFGQKANPSQEGTGATNLVNDALPPEMQIGAQPQIAPRKPDLYGAYGALAGSGIPELQRMGMQGMVQMPQLQAQQQAREEDRTFRQQEAQAARDARAQELQMRMQDARTSQQERLQAQKELREMQIQAQKDTQRMIAANRPAPQVQTIQTENGILERRGNEWVPVTVGGKPALPKGAGASSGAAAKPLTESQAKGSLYLGQMRTANDELDKLEAKGEAASPAAVAATGSTWTNWATGKEAQKVAQLQNQWAEGFLRAKTGAAATTDEVALNRRTFFPVIGDGEDVIKQKKQMRRQAEKDMEIVAGSGASRAGGATGSWGETSNTGWSITPVQ